MGANIVEIILKATDQASKVFDNTGKAGKKFTDTLGKLSTGALAVTGAIASTGVALKKAFDLGKEGAAILQTSESFDMLLEKVGVAPDLFNRLKKAAGGTISEMELMSATATLLAGASGELGTALGEATPQLMEIARAANKLNPSLGTTTFLYESLATGIKRASPMILDNLGLTIKVGEANDKLAAQLGKTAEELTAEEQKMALLNETLRAGGVLIDQVGGDVEGAGDSFAKMDAAVADAGNAVKTRFVPFIKNAADAIYILLMRAELLDAFLQEHSDEVAKTADNYEDYVDEMLRANVVAGKMKQKEADLLRTAFLTGDATDYMAKMFNYTAEEAEFAGYSLSIYGELIKPMIEDLGILTRGQFMFGDAMAATVDQGVLLQQQMESGRGSVEEYVSALPRAISGNKELAGSTLGAAHEMHKLGEEAGATASRLDGVSTGLFNTIEAQKELIKWIAGGGGVLNDMADQVMEMYDQGLIDGDTALTALGEVQLGVVDLEEELGMITTEEAVEKLVEMGYPVDEAKVKVDELQEKLFALTSHKYVIDVIVNGGTGAPTPGPGRTNPTTTTGGGGGDQTPFGIRTASGADFMVPPGYPNDSFGPIWAQSGEHVQVTPRGQSGGNRPVVYNNTYHVTIETAEAARAWDAARMAREAAELRANL